MDISKKDPKWVYEDKDFGFYAAPAVNDSHVFIGSWTKHLHAVDREAVASMAFQDRFRIDGGALPGCRCFRIWGWEGLRGGSVNGKELWRVDLGEGISSDLAFANGRIVVGGSDGTLFCIGGQ